jgi:hypothetical protein
MHRLNSQAAASQLVANLTVHVFGGAIMARYKPRFRISIKDQATGKKLKIELLPMPWPGRFAVRQNGKRPRKKAFATTSEVFARLRSWVAQQPFIYP